MLVHAMQEQYKLVNVMGHPMLFTTSHIDREALPKGMYLYAVRHMDKSESVPCEIGEWILVNRFGALISNEPIVLYRSTKLNNAYRSIDAKTEWKPSRKHMTLLEYMMQHPPKVEKRRGRER